MNRNVGGMLLTAVVFAVLAIPSSPIHQGQQGAPSRPGTRQPAAPSPSRSRTPQHKTKLCPSCIAKSQQDDLKDEIQEFLGKDVPSLDERIVVDVLIVTVPDPVGTHLSLFFDRTLDALQQALTRDGYLFAGATLPWDAKQHAESDDWQTRQGQLEFEHSRGEMPGLLIYRKGLQDGGKNAIPLFILVVGETPTTGIHKDQFLKALALFNAWSQTPTHLRILGPTFSGSLYSMIEILNLDNRLKGYDLYLHSGTITSGRTVAIFKKWLEQNHFDNVHFVSFQENDDYGLQQFLAYVRTRGYLRTDKRDTLEDCYCRIKTHEKCSPRASCSKHQTGDLPRITSVLVLTEDETAYGIRPEGPSGGGQSVHTNRSSEEQFCDDVPEHSLVTTLSFPRDISQLRSAYQQDFLRSEASADRKVTLHTSLPLDLEDSGGDKDTIGSYAHRQTPLSQEAVLFGIIVDLKKLHPDFVVIRATNPLDELFLARFLRKAYPKVRVVTIGADLLFERQKDDAFLEGTLAISPYSLRPDADRYIPPIVPSQDEHVSILTFPSTFSAGVYNAALSLLECKLLGAPVAKSTCADAPPAPYHEYGWSREWPEDDSARSIARPPLWLLVLGNDGYWPLARLNSDRLLSEFTSPHRTLPQTVPVTRPKYNISYHLSKDWKVFSLVVVSISVIFSFLCWIGSGGSASELLSAFDRSPDPHRTFYLTASATILLISLCGLLLPYAWIPFLDSPFLLIAIPIGALCILILFPLNLDHRQAPRGLQLFRESSALIFLAFLLIFIWPPYFRDYVSLSRLQHVTSGVSPALPVYLLFAAFLWWCLKGLQGQALLDVRCPKLPSLKDLPRLSLIPVLGDARDLTEEGNRKLISILLSPFSGLLRFFSRWIRFEKTKAKGRLSLLRKFAGPRKQASTNVADLWVTYRIAVPVGSFLFVAFFLLDRHHPIYSLEGEIFDRAYAYGVAFALFLLLTDLGRLLAGWLECRRLLRALEQLPLRRAFTDIKGFSWRPIWRLGGGPRRILSREWESWQKYHLISQGKPMPKEAAPGAKITNQIAFFAKHCGEVMKFLVEKWATESELESITSPQLHCCPQGSSEKETAFEPTAIVKSAERFVCFVYLNFVLTVLLRLRIFAFSVAGLYVVLVISLTSYPFEPRLAIRSFMILFLLLILAVVATVYAQVHRDPTLSRITNTNAGELGVDFWLRMASFAALPTLGLLAAQFPEIGGFLFSWLQPALDALTK